MVNIVIQNVWETIAAVLLAIGGGLARILYAKDSSALKISGIIAELFISGFTGLMILSFARANSIEGDWLGVISGMAGWIGPKLLDVTVKMTNKLLGIYQSEK